MNDSIRPGPPPVPPQPEDIPKVILVPKVPTPWEYTFHHIEGAKKAANNILQFVAAMFIALVVLWFAFAIIMMIIVH